MREASGYNEENVGNNITFTKKKEEREETVKVPQHFSLDGSFDFFFNFG